MVRLVLFIMILMSSFSVLAESVCFGSTSKGALTGAVKLPSKGANFVSYSSLAGVAGRTYVHSVVQNIVLAAYASLEREQPQKRYKYAETGLKEGGAFKPHKTHQNGLSVDFMTPVKNLKGESVHLPTNVLNKLGYNIEFDTAGKYDDLTIDYDALAAHIVALDKQAKAKGYDLWRVIFDPKLQPNLYKTQYASYLKENILFSKKRSWVRHDEHYHVDFSVPCQPYK